MEFANFNSSALTAGAYQPTTQVLTLWFTSAPHVGYDYPGVPAHLWQGLCSARSAGTYYNDHIRDRYGIQRTRSFLQRR